MMLHQPRRSEPRKGSSGLGTYAVAQSVLSWAFDAVIPYSVRRKMTGQRGPPLSSKKYERVEPRAVAHRHHRLERPSADSIREPHGYAPTKKEPVIAPAL